MHKRMQELFGIDGASETELDEFEINLKSVKTEYQKLLTDYEISLIGFRDQDLLETYGQVPDNVKAKRAQLIKLNTRSLAAELDVARAGLSSNRAELESVNILLDEMNIKAFYTGTVGAKYLEVGERVKMGDKILTTFVDGKVYAVFPVQESKSLYIVKDMPVIISVPSIDLPPLRAKITHISPTVDPQSGNITVKAVIEDAEQILKPGMFFKVEIITENFSESLLLPESCFISLTENSGRLFIIKNNRAFSKNR